MHEVHLLDEQEEAKERRRASEVPEFIANTLGTGGADNAPEGIEDLALAEKADDLEEGETLTPFWKYYYIVIFVFVSITDGFLIGYNVALTAIFTEKQVPSEKRSVLGIVVAMYMLRLFVAPITDKYFVPRLGKRKTYLLPGKLINAFLYALGSMFIQNWVESESIWTISFFFLAQNVTMLFENNAMIGFRLDVFGKKEAGAAAACQTLGFFFGISIGLQLFTALSSAYICDLLFGLKEPILTHTSMWRIVAGLYLSSFVILIFIKERQHEVHHESSAAMNPINVVKAIFKIDPLRKHLLWNFFGPTMSFGMKLVSSQYYIKKGVKREDQVLLVALAAVPFTVISNMVWMRFTKIGHLTLFLWATVMASVCFETLHALNCYTFDAETNYKRTMITICAITALEIMANWNLFQHTFYLRSSPKKYTLTYISTINSLIVAFRGLPLMAFNAIVDHVAIMYLFLACLLLQVIYNLATFKIVNAIDKVDPSSIGEEFILNLEGFYQVKEENGDNQGKLILGR